MNLKRISSFSIFFLSTSVFIAQAQDVKPPEKTVSSEIEVIRPYKPILAEAVKLRRSPDLDNLKTYRAKFSYAPIDRKLELNTDIQKLQAQQLADERATPLINNYLKAGAGNLTTLLAEGYFGTGQDEALQTGVFFRHFSQAGKRYRQNENNQQVSVFGRSIGEKSTLNGRLNYERHGLYFYGIDALNPTLNTDPQKQVYNFFELDGEIVNRFSTNENALSYSAKANFYLLNDRFNAKENLLSVSSYMNKRISNLNLGLSAAAEIGSTKDSLTSVSNHILRINPYITLQPKGVKITAGVNVVQEFGSSSATRIFPSVTADFVLIPDFLQIFGEVKGDVKRNSLKNFSDENPFLNSNIVFKNSVEKLSISAGIKGSGGPGFGYKAMIYNKKITDMPLFVNNFITSHKFDVIYDFGDMRLFGIEGELSVQVSDNLKWTGKLNIEDYKPATEQKSYYKPQLRVSSNLNYTINNKLTFKASVAVQDDSKAKVFLFSPYVPGTTNYWLIPNPQQEEIVTVKGFVDLCVSGNYQINSKFSAFVNFNNLLNTKYNRFLYYPMNGISAYGGLTYAF